MDAKRYSLNEIFGILSESTMILDRSITLVAEDDAGKETRVVMPLHQFIGMSVARELTSGNSRVLSEDDTASKADVVAAMDASYYTEEAHPNYEHFGISWGVGGKRKTRRNTRR